MRGFFGVLFVGLIAIVAGLVGYQAGLASTAVEAGRTVIVGLFVSPRRNPAS